MTRFAALLLLAFALRLFFAVAFYGNIDQHLYDEIAAIIEQGGNVYESPHYNYSAIWMHVLDVSQKVARVLDVPFHTVLRSFLSLVDVGNALLIAAIVQRRSSSEGRYAAQRYALNPGVILIIGFHGQFESLAALPVLCALYLVARHGRHPRQA